MGLTQGPDQKGDFAQKTIPHYNVLFYKEGLILWNYFSWLGQYSETKATLYSTVKLSAVKVHEYSKVRKGKSVRICSNRYGWKSVRICSNRYGWKYVRIC